MTLRRAGTMVVLGIAAAACRDPSAPLYFPPPIVASAIITGIVTAPNGQPVQAQFVYVFSNFTPTCSASAAQVSLVRTNAAGVFQFDRVAAPNEGQDLCVTVLVRPEANTGFTESGRLDGFVDFRLFAPLDTVRFDVQLTLR